MSHESYEETVAKQYERFSYLTPHQRLQWLQQARHFNSAVDQSNPERRRLVEYFRQLTVGKSAEESERDLSRITEEVKKKEVKKERGCASEISDIGF